MYKKIQIITWFFMTFFSMNSYADSDRGSELDGFEPSYFIYSIDDENHLEFKISIKYPLLDKSEPKLNKVLKGKKNQLYFAYTGKYDFFLFSDDVDGRQSAPIISRLQNPGLFVKHWFEEDQDEGLDSISVGWFHESNGQQITDRNEFLNTKNASDFVSRGWDYLGADLKYIESESWLDDDNLNYYLRLKLFCNCQGFGMFDKEDDVSVFGVTEDLEIGDFDGLRLLVRNDTDRKFNYAFSVRSGISGIDALGNLSYQVELTRRCWNIPFTILYFNGYGKDISTYHIKDEYLGIGLKMW